MYEYINEDFSVTAQSTQPPPSLGRSQHLTPTKRHVSKSLRFIFAALVLSLRSKGLPVAPVSTGAELSNELYSSHFYIPPMLSTKRTEQSKKFFFVQMNLFAKQE